MIFYTKRLRYNYINTDNMKIYLYILALIGSLFSIQGIWGQTTVTSESDLRNAINEALPESEIIIGDNIDLASTTIDINKSITIKGKAGNEKFKVKAATGYRIFNVKPGNTVNFENLQMEGSTASSEIFYNHGGGCIYVDNSVTSFKNIDFTNSGVVSHGGAIGSLGGKKMLVQDCSFKDITSSSDGGVIFMVGLSGDGVNLEISGKTIFQNNTVSATDTEGGIIYVNSIESCNIIIEDEVQFIGNASSWAGAIFVQASDDGQVSIQGATFTANTATYHGGALCVYGPALKLDDCSFTGNKIVGDSYDVGFGGAICLSGPVFQVESCTFKENSVEEYAYGLGGAIVIYQYDDLQATINNTTFENNYAAKGGAILTNAKLILTGNTFSKNKGVFGGTINFDSKLELSENTFTGNHALKGGVFYQWGESELTCAKNIFTSNHADGDANVLGGVLYVEKGKAMTFDGDNFTGNYSMDGSGGAIYIDDIDEMEKSSLKDCIFKGNYAGRNGGGAILSYISLDITDCVFSDNYTVNSLGGALFIRGTTNHTIIDNTSFSDNKAGSSEGGAIFLHNATLDIKNKGNKTFFYRNKADESGGAISIWGGKLSLTNVILGKLGEKDEDPSNGNTAPSGGALYIYEGSIAMEGGIIEGNRAGIGSAISCEEATSLNLFNVSIVSNTATEDNGGAISLDDVGSANLTNVLLAKNRGESGKGTGVYNGSPSKKTVFTNVTIADNTALTESTGIINNGKLELQNTVVWGNAEAGSPNVVNKGAGSADYYYSLIEGVAAAEADGNLDSSLPDNAPVFLGTMDLFPYYGLVASGGGIDVGKDKYFTDAAPGKTKDLFGAGRFNGRIDMGAYEQAANVVEFTGDASVCEGTSANLTLKFTGNAPWDLVYKKDNSSNENLHVTQSMLENGTYVLKGLGAGKYSLVSVTGADGSELGVPGKKYEATVSSVSNPSVEAISGPTEVVVGQSISLSNATSGGTWMVSNSNATITLGGQLTGVAEGTVEVWYVVNGSAPTSCETIVTYAVTVKAQGGTDPGPVDPDPEDPDPVDPDPVDPEPEWPPVVPEPDPDPDPDPDAWIIIRPGTEACFTDESFNVSFRLQYTAKPLRYAVAFTDISKTAGFEDVKTYMDLPQDGIASITIPKEVKPGTYSGYLLLIEKGSAEYKMYPFAVNIMGGVTITEQPQPITQQSTGERFNLSVKAQGDNLTYQWFYSGQRIEGATAATYETIYSADKEGLYYVEVYGDCGWIESEEVMVTGCFGILIKWDDVIYVQNTDGRYVSFQWYRNGEAINTYGTSIYYTDPAGLQGIYYVRAYKADGTYDQSCQVEYTTVTRASSVAVYPTVVERNHYVNVESDELGGSYVGGIVEIYNLSGGKVYSQRLLTPQVQIPVNQPTGVYILHVTAPDGRRKTEKIVVR